MARTVWIVEEAVVFVHADGKREAGRIAIGKPFRVDENESRCPIALDGMHKLRTISGNCPLQAMLLAIQFLGHLLHGFTEQGGRVLDSDGNEIPLSAYFGPLLRDPVISASQRRSLTSRPRGRPPRRGSRRPRRGTR